MDEWIKRQEKRALVEMFCTRLVLFCVFHVVSQPTESPHKTLHKSFREEAPSSLIPSDEWNLTYPVFHRRHLTFAFVALGHYRQAEQWISFDSLCIHFKKPITNGVNPGRVVCV